MVPVNTQSPHSSLHLRVKRSRPHTQPHKKCFLYNFGTRFPFHISILLGAAEINLRQFGVSLLFPPVSCAKSSEKEAAPRDSCCGFVTTEQSSFLWGLQWSFDASHLPFPTPRAPSCVPLFSYFHVICRHQGPPWASHAMLVMRTGHLSQACLALPSTHFSRASLLLCLGKWPSSSLLSDYANL